MKKWSLGNNDDGNPDDPPEIEQVHKDQEQESIPQGVAEKSGTKKQKLIFSVSGEKLKYHMK